MILFRIIKGQLSDRFTLHSKLSTFRLFLVFFFLLTNIVVPAKVFSAKVIKVATFSFAPLISTDERGITEGLNADLIERIAEENGLQISYRFGSWNDGLERARKKEVDLLTSVMYTEERDQFLDYSQKSVFTVWGGAYALPESKIESILDLQHQQVAIMQGDANGLNFKKHAQSFDLTCQYVEVPSLDDVFRLVQQGKVSAGIAPNIFGFLHAPKFQLVQTPVIFSPKPLFFAVPQGTNPELIEAIDSALARWKGERNSFYYQSLRKWLSPDEPGHETLPKWFLPSLGGTFALLLLLFFWAQLLKRQVRSRTHELSEKRQQLLALYDNSPDMYVSVSAKDASILQCNDTLARKLGYSKDAIVGRAVFDLYHPDCLADAKKTFGEFRKTGVIKDRNLKLQKKDGSPLDVSLNVSSVRDSSGKILYSISSWRDITDQQLAKEEKIKLEYQLYQSQKVESLGRLAGGIAHDYNNMLSVILGNLELARMKIDPATPAQHNLEQIFYAANRSRDITQQLLAFARKQIINPEAMDLNVNVERALKMLRNLLGENIDLAWFPKDNIWPVKMDPSQLDQILANLCINARDAITDTGKMTIETGNVTFDQVYCEDHPGFIPGNFTMIAISDNGCGMDSSTLKNIFEPFFTTKKTGEGTGLGLATVYGIIKQNNGFINVYSEPGQGTTFKTYLPRCIEEPTARQEENTDEVLKGHGETILLVEDEVAIVEIVTTMLSDLGYTVLPANSPAEALKLAESIKDGIDLLITDVVMPDMNGREMAAQLRHIHREMKSLYMSGYTANVIAHHGVLDEGINFIQKPFSRNSLSVLVRKILDSATPAEP